MFLACGLLASVAARADEAGSFDRAVKPLLARHCVSCHGAEKTKGGVRFDGGIPDLTDAKQSETWLAADGNRNMWILRRRSAGLH
jgi:mono/diheme cytochrome c family protein